MCEMVFQGEVQAIVDETSDGRWEAALYIGSNFVTRFHADSFRAAVVELERAIASSRELPEENGDA